MSVCKIKNFPLEIKDVDSETTDELMKLFLGKYLDI